MNWYEERRKQKSERLRARAAAKRAERDVLLERTRSLAEAMNGQPILIGHHSEKRHRRDIARMDRDIHKMCELDREAARFEDRARAAESSTAVFSDDPEAVCKIKEKIASRERYREKCKAINAILRRAKRKSDKTGRAWEPEAIEELYRIYAPRA